MKRKITSKAKLIPTMPEFRASAEIYALSNYLN